MTQQQLRNTAIVSPTAPNRGSIQRVDGELWVHAETLQMYVFQENFNDDGTGAWIGVTSGQTNGSIVYSGPNPPTLLDTVPNAVEDNLQDQALDPLPGTCWYDTTNNALKIYYVYPNVLPYDDGSGSGDVESYTGVWVSMTTSHFLTEATNNKIAELEAIVTDLTAKIEILEQNCP